MTKYHTALLAMTLVGSSTQFEIQSMHFCKNTFSQLPSHSNILNILEESSRQSSINTSVLSAYSQTGAFLFLWFEKSPVSTVGLSEFTIVLDGLISAEVQSKALVSNLC